MKRMTLAALAIVATLGTAQAEFYDPYTPEGRQFHEEYTNRVNEDRMRAIESRQFEDRMRYESDQFRDTQRRNADFYMSR